MASMIGFAVQGKRPPERLAGQAMLRRFAGPAPTLVQQRMQVLFSHMRDAL